MTRPRRRLKSQDSSPSSLATPRTRPEDAKDKVEEAAEDAKDKAEEIAEDVKDKAEDVKDELEK